VSPHTCQVCGRKMKQGTRYVTERGDMMAQV
jgi:hypothetical protein